MRQVQWVCVTYVVAVHTVNGTPTPRGETHYTERRMERTRVEWEDEGKNEWQGGSTWACFVFGQTVKNGPRQATNGFRRYIEMG